MEIYRSDQTFSVITFLGKFQGKSLSTSKFDDRIAFFKIGLQHMPKH